VLKSVGIYEPCAAEESAGSLHFHVDLVFPPLVAEDFHGELLSKLPCIPVRKHFVLISGQCCRVAEAEEYVFVPMASIVL
jgi:hypothetical protein